MNSRIRIFCALFGFALLCPSLGHAAEEAQAWDEVDALVQGSGDMSEANHLAEALRQKRAESVRTLVGVLQDDTRDNATRIAATRMLGMLRAPEAVEPLVAELTLSPEYIDEKTDETMRPCVYALISIGKPASNAALEHLAREEDATRRKYLCDVVVAVEGPKIAEFLIKERLSASPNSKVRRNLGLARDIITGKAQPKSQ